jgi:hypothetical protein
VVENRVALCIHGWLGVSVDAKGSELLASRKNQRSTSDSDSLTEVYATDLERLAGSWLEKPLPPPSNDAMGSVRLPLGKERLWWPRTCCTSVTGMHAYS